MKKIEAVIQDFKVGSSMKQVEAIIKPYGKKRSGCDLA